MVPQPPPDSPRQIDRVAMTRKLRDRLTYANVMSTLAVFLFLASGTAYASHLIVRSSDIVNNSLRSVDIKERTLGQVPAAALGGMGRSAASAGTCDPEFFSYDRCVHLVGSKLALCYANFAECLNSCSENPSVASTITLSSVRDRHRGPGEQREGRCRDAPALQLPSLNR
jgi:hypothetical protein